MDAYDRGSGRYEGGRGDMREDLGGPNAGSRSRWGPGGGDRRGGDYPSKRRRY